MDEDFETTFNDWQQGQYENFQGLVQLSEQ
jgi:hypothetical protein